MIKAQPHRSSQYFETVCCAGVGRDQKWRRQYPVPFRLLKDEQKFARWEWISYDFVRPKDDKRSESQKVISKSLTAKGRMKSAERADFLAPLVRGSLSEADERRESLTLIRPRSIRLEAQLKSQQELESETLKHKALADQLSLLEEDEVVEPLKPCRMQFVLHWQDQDRCSHRQECDDWETVAAFNRFDREYGESRAVSFLKEKYEDQYFKAGIVLGLSTHSRRNIENNTKNQWLLVGLIRLNETTQSSLF
ncbi:MAG: hypothetical protein KDE25_13290 [Novosphingobium sp.]|nr:hypothetical protein [Novosphingobium sp.]